MISVKNIYKQFGKQQVLKGVSCDIQPGEKIVIIGPSGSGKSTFLRCMNLLEEPTFGEIWIDNKLITPVDPYLHFEIIRLSNTYKTMLRAKKLVVLDKSESQLDQEIIDEIKQNDLLKNNEGKEFKQAIKKLYNESFININLARQKMGMVFQNFNLFNNLNIIDNLTLAPVKLKLKTKQEAEEKAMQLLKRIGLEDKAQAYPSTLSGGQKQRIAIVRALCMDPEIMLFDEPTSALDIEMIHEVLEVIEQLANDGMTMVIVTHELKFAKNIASKVLFLADGKIIESGTPDELFNHPKHPRLVDFLEKTK